MKKIKITCKVQKYLPIDQIKNFQGDLKTIDRHELEKAKGSIKKYGFSFPVFVWRKYILDGHQRILATRGLLKQGYKIDDIPVVEIQATNRKEAAEKLLLVNSRYAKITKKGLAGFIEDFEIEIADIAGNIEFTEKNLDEFLAELMKEEEKEDPAENEIETLKPDKIISREIESADKIIYQFSGGRDSTLAVLKTLDLVKDKEPEACFVDTGAEFPDILYFVFKFCEKQDLKLNILHPKRNFFELFAGKKTFPDPVYRNCIQPLINDPVDDVVYQHDNALVIRGGRKTQKTSTSKSNIINKFERKKTIKILNPLFVMTDEEYKEDVQNMHKWAGYDKGFVRTACWCCPFQTAVQWESVKKYYPMLWDEMREMAKSWAFKEYIGDGNIKRFRKYWDAQ